MTLPNRNNVSIYACGGCGINIVGSLPDVAAAAGVAKASLYAIDTSRSNLRSSGFNQDNTYLFEGTNGSGKVRGENLSVIVKNAKQILQQFKPGDFNIVVHSGGGGSGGPIGAILVSEMLAEGIPVVAIVVGSTDSHAEVENTIKTLQTYDGLARDVEYPMVVHYLENGGAEGAARKTIDSGAHSAIHALLMLFSGQNDEMDTADVRNWIKRAGAAEVFALQFCPTQEAYDKAGTVLSVATLATRDHNTSLRPSPAYQAVGYVVDDVVAAGLKQALHYALSGNLVDDCVKALKKRHSENEKRLASVVRRDDLGGCAYRVNGIVI